MRLPNLGLRSKVSIIIFLSLLGCFLLLGLVVHGVTQRKIRETIEKQMFEETQLASSMVKEFMEDSVEEIEGHSRDQDLRTAILSGNTKAIDAELDSLISSMRKFENFIVFDKHGYIRAISTPPGKAIVGKYYGYRAYFQRAMKTKQTALGDPVISGSLKKPVVHIAAPIKDNKGAIQAVLVAGLSLDYLSRRFELMRMGKSGFIVLVSQDGKILAHPDRSQLFIPAREVIPSFQKIQKKESGLCEAQDTAGKKFFYVWAVLPKYQWILVAHRPSQEVYEPLKTTGRLVLGGSIFILIVAVAACVHFVNRFVLHPLKDIQSNLAEISSGKMPSRLPVKSGDELQVLSEDITKMAGSLHQSYESLSRRHRELSVLNAIAAVSSRSLDLQEILETTLEKALLLMDIQVGNVRLYNPVKRKLILAASRGVSLEYLQDFSEIDIDNQDSYAAQAAAGGRAVLVEDMRKNRRLVKAFLTRLETEKPHGLVCVPMKVKDKLIGTMGFIGRENHIFTAEEVDIFTSIGNQLAVAIEKAALWKAEREARQKERERAQELGMLFATGRLLTTSLNLDEILKSIVETTALLMEANRCNLMLKDDQGRLKFAYTKDIPQEFLDIKELAPGESLSGWVASRGELLYVLKMDEDPRFKFPELARKHGFHSFLGVPLKAKNEVIGVLNVYTDQFRTFEEEEIRLLSTVGDYAAIAIQQARDRQKLEAQILQRHRELSTLNAIASTLSRSLDLNQVLEDAIDMIMRVMNADKAVIYLQEGEKLRLVVHRGLSSALLKRISYISTERSYIWKYLKDHDLRIASPVLPAEILRTIPEFEQENIQVALDVKLRGKREDLGFLTVFYCQPREFEEAERHLLVSVGHQVSAAVENAQLYQRTLRSYLQRQVVSEINSEISVQLDLGPLLFLIARRAAELIRADASIIGLYDPRSGRVYPKGWFNMPGEVKDFSLVFSEAEWKAMDGQGQGLLWNEHRDLPLEGVSWNPSEVSALMAQPLHSQGEFLGLILLLNFGEHKFFQEEDGEFLALLAGQGAIAIQNAQYIKEIMDLDQQRENYLSNVSHELRTPLTLIRGYSEAVKDGSVEREGERQECLGIIVKECDRLTRLVEGLLLLPRLEMDDPYKTLQLSLVPFNEQITSCLQLIKPDLEEKGILVESQLPIYPKIWADSDMIFQVIFNLLANAVKFTPVNGNIFLGGKVEDREIEFQVMNTGREIPPEHLDKIFDKFYMIEGGLTKKHRGMGLGLYIVKKIVELHHGRVWVRSDAQTGTSFYVVLPREEA